MLSGAASTVGAESVAPDAWSPSVADWVLLVLQPVVIQAATAITTHAIESLIVDPFPSEASFSGHQAKFLTPLN